MMNSRFFNEDRLIQTDDVDVLKIFDPPLYINGRYRGRVGALNSDCPLIKPKFRYLCLKNSRRKV